MLMQRQLGVAAGLLLKCGSETTKELATNRRKSFCSKKYRRWELNPHVVAHTGF